MTISPDGLEIWSGCLDRTPGKCQLGLARALRHAQGKRRAIMRPR